MMTERRRMLAATAFVTVCTMAAAWLALRPAPPDHSSLSMSFASGLTRALKGAEVERAPRHCAHLEHRATQLSFARDGLSMRGDFIELTGPNARVGVWTNLGLHAEVADVRDWFIQHQVAAVVILGGSGNEAQSSKTNLDMLSRRSELTVIVVPGAEDGISQLRETIGELQASGRAIWDGSQIRFIESKLFVIALLPGMNETLIEKEPDRCVYVERDVHDVVQALGTRKGTRPSALLSQWPPRQTGEHGTDLSFGVHIGDRWLSEALVNNPCELILSGIDLDTKSRLDAVTQPQIANAGQYPLILSARGSEFAVTGYHTNDEPTQ